MSLCTDSTFQEVMSYRLSSWKNSCTLFSRKSNSSLESSLSASTFLFSSFWASFSEGKKIYTTLVCLSVFKVAGVICIIELRKKKKKKRKEKTAYK